VSYDLQVAVGRPPDPRALGDAIALPDLRLSPDLDPDAAPPARWPEGGLRLWRDGISTRATELDFDAGKLRVVIRALACREDCDLALRAAEAAARLAGVGSIQTDYFGDTPLADLGRLHSTVWMDHQAASGTSSLAALIRDRRGPLAMPGPRRSCVIGTRLLGELEAAGAAAELPARVLATLRRVQWDVPEDFRDAAVFLAGGEGERKTEFAVWVPDENLVIPFVDYVALRVTAGEVVMLPFAAVAGLAGARATLLDECQLLVPASAPDAWARIIAAARPLATTPRSRTASS
jgi:hypothetical protein